jgi:hypothetical protein
LDKNESVLDKYRTEIEIEKKKKKNIDQLERLYFENDEKNQTN